MTQIPKPFPVPDWNVNPADYPMVYLVDKNWSETSEFNIEKRSFTAPALSGDTPLAAPLETDHHGERTLQVVKSIAKGIPNDQIVLVSCDRKNEINNFDQHQSNLPEALISIQPLVKPGDLVVINLASDAASDGGQDSFARDPLIAMLLEEITDILGSIVITAAGNSIKPMLPALTSDTIIVGGIMSDGRPASRFGSALTCCSIVPYDLPGLPEAYKDPVPFGRSSAATAYTAGMVLMMLNYAASQSLILNGKQVVGLLKANSIMFSLQSSDGTSSFWSNIPDWNKLKPAIDLLLINA